ncbi:MAG: DUF4886 domain-containing protein [Armatimonadetes bacterium]|nr:DUF4886 domain-containing protein [Armatimonadota bacterium]
MKAIRLRHVLLASLLVGTAVAAQPAPKVVRLLAVGNSFSQNATTYLPSLVKAAGHQLILHQCAIGGGTLAQHWDKVTQLAADPTDKRGRYSSGKTLQEELSAEKWDVVTIQQASIKSHDANTYRPFAGQLAGFIKQYAPSATLWLHQTWAYRCDDPRFRPAKPAAGEPPSQEAMYRQLTSAYETIAKELGVGLLPVGDAFWLADSDPAWGFKPGPAFDPKTIAAPTVPAQPHSLHVGWRWSTDAKGKTTFGYDGHHASVAGQYLGACVWFEVLYGGVVDNSFVPKGLSAEDARYLREDAARAVRARREAARQAAAPAG